MIQGCDCSIVIKTAYTEMDVPYSSETLREAVSILYEEAAIEGDGIRRGVKTTGGVTGCIVTPLCIGTAPLLLYLAMGGAGLPVFVSGTRNIYQYRLNLLPMEKTSLFDLIQDRGAVANGIGARKLFEGCRVKGFELRIIRGEAVKLKLDIAGEFAPAIYPYTDTFKREHGERFSGDCAAYRINGKEYKNIYGVTLASVKEGGTKTELWVRRVLENGLDIPEIIEDFTITTRLLRDTYEARHYGTFTITLKRLVMVSDETDVDCSGAVIGPVRFHVSGTVTTEIFTSGETRL